MQYVEMARSLALCLAGAAALQAPAPRPARTALGSTEIGVGPETGGVMWDPAGFGKLASPTTMKWFRASELKHGRVAMLATLGRAVERRRRHPLPARVGPRAAVDQAPRGERPAP